MNKLRAFVAGRIADRPTSDAPRVATEHESKGRFRMWGKNDSRAKRKRIAKRRAKKGYK